MELKWTSKSDPYSSAFDDIYYAEEGGLEESRYVFIEQNQLEEKIRSDRNLVVGELGFGTGLNFLATFELWQRTRSPSSGWLHYISCEKFPLTSEQIRTALSRWSELTLFVEKFLSHYGPFTPGFHRIRFEDEKIILTLLIGDALSSLRKLRAKIDVWYFDGFSPRKNPEMWSEEIFREVAKLSRSGASFATYAAAGHVRRSIQTAGFQIEKFKGFGRKRDMVRGRLEGTRTQRNSGSASAIVIGGGIAGVSTASALAKRGCAVTLIERDSIASRASHNASANTLPILSVEPTRLHQISWAGYYFLRSLRKLSGQGILQLNIDDRKFERWKRALSVLEIPAVSAQILDAAKASELAGISISSEAIHFSEGGSLNIPKYCQSEISIQQSTLKVITGTKASAIQRSDGLWKVSSEIGEIIAEAEVLVLASAHSIGEFVSPEVLPLRKVRGQAAYLATNPSLSPLNKILCFDGFLTPHNSDGLHFLGATYDNEDYDLKIRESENQDLLKRLTKALPRLNVSDLKISANWSELRTNVPGMAPVVGKLETPQGEIYISTALSSRGSLYGPLFGEILASEILSEPLPIESDLYDSLSPQRFTRHR